MGQAVLLDLEGGTDKYLS